MRARVREKCPIAWGDAAKGVSRGVADGIRLGLDDAPARPAFRERPHEHFPDEKTSELAGIDWHLCPLQHTQAHHCRVDFILFARPNAPSKPGLERVRKVLGLAGHLAIQELHDAHRIGWPAVIRQDEFRDPEVTRADDRRTLKRSSSAARRERPECCACPLSAHPIADTPALRPLGRCRARHRSHSHQMQPNGHPTPLECSGLQFRYSLASLSHSNVQTPDVSHITIPYHPRPHHSEGMTGRSHHVALTPNTAKRRSESVQIALTPQRPSSTISMKLRTSYFRELSVWIVSPASNAKRRPSIVTICSRRLTRCISTANSASFHRASCRSNPGEKSPHSSRLIRVSRLRLNAAVTPSRSS